MPRKQVSSTLSRFLAFIAVTLISLSAAAQTNFKVLYNFKGGTDGEPLFGALALDQSGNLYGTAAGGPHNYWCDGTCGRVYKLTPHADGKWTESVLHDFQYSKSDGHWPMSGVIRGEAGILYGTTQGGGTHNAGTVYQLKPSTRGWTETVLYNFYDGVPDGSLLRDRAGKFYGLAGYPYELWHGTDGQWHERALYRFQCGGSDGCGPVGTLISDGKGNLYGATKFGGNYPPMCSGSAGCGTVFELAREANGKWKEHILHRFAQFKDDGQLPFAGLVMDSQGNLYGTTYEGGAHQTGTLFELRRGQNGQWRETILFDFSKNDDGGGPLAAMTLAAAGNLYGTTVYGGTQACSCGVVFKLALASGGKWIYSVLHSFSGSDGESPQAGLTLDGKGNLYGTTPSGGTYFYGVVFEITP
jgi:uncharacterized repeat protein (TIGR03803 family)